MECLRCDGTGRVRNEFGMMERCGSCRGPEMSFERVEGGADPREEGG